MKHLDLFSGIGGFAYALDEVFENVEHIFCDNDLFCQKVLAKHWPNSKIYGDIRDITHTDWDRLQEQGKKQQAGGTRQFYEVDILTGGFPCQPFSQAGKRRGTEDDRYLWPEMLRVIRLAKPQWVIAENVRGLLTLEGGMVFEQVCLDLEASGYEVQPFIIPAIAVNAPHRRDRIWFVAHRTSGKSRKQTEQKGREDTGGTDKNAPDTATQRLERKKSTRKLRGQINFAKCDWKRDWREVAFATCDVRMDDGLSPGLDFAGFTKARHRTERLKSLGNSIVPQVAIEIIKSLFKQT